MMDLDAFLVATIILFAISTILLIWLGLFLWLQVLPPDEEEPPTSR